MRRDESKFSFIKDVALSMLVYSSLLLVVVFILALAQFIMGELMDFVYIVLLICGVVVLLELFLWLGAWLLERWYG